VSVCYAGEGNLSDRQVLIQVGRPGPNARVYLPAITDEEFDAQRGPVEDWAESLGGATVVPLEVAVDDAEARRVDGRMQNPTVIQGVKVGSNILRDTPRLRCWTSSRSRPAASTTTYSFSHRTGMTDLSFVGDFPRPMSRDPIDAVDRFDSSPYSSVPHALITERGMEFGGWTPAPAGWLVESAEPLTDDQLVAARDVAAQVGQTVESRDAQSGLQTPRTAATGIGIALAILAMTVGLIRAVTAGEVRTLTAVGAGSRTRRGVSAATPPVLAVVAVVLGTGSAYAAVIAGYTPDTERLHIVPVDELLIIAIEFPAAAIVASWLLAGRQPRHLGRRLTE
jgi:putative ABC transport system permease protein